MLTGGFSGFLSDSAGLFGGRPSAAAISGGQVRQGPGGLPFTAPFRYGLYPLAVLSLCEAPVEFGVSTK